MAPLAQGGMAEIWLARQSGPKGFERLVVIKRMINALESDPEHIEMFLTEARLAAQLNHPHVIQIFDLGEFNGSLYLVMEYLDGENLSVVRRMGLRQELPLSDHHAVRMIAWAADGLHYAHTRVGVDGKPLGIVHRDVSPQNLFATFNGGLKVLDFGVAKLATEHTTSGKLKGKLGYLSPEQARGEPLDGRSDVFSLGIVLFELLTRTRLLPTLEETQMLATIAHGRMPVAIERRPDLDPALDRIVGKALATNRDERFQTAREFQQALEEWLQRQGRVVTTGDLADFLRSIFAKRIEERHTMIETAMRAEMTPRAMRDVQDLAVVASSASSTSKSHARRAQKRRRIVVPFVVGGALLGITVGGIAVGVSSKSPGRELKVSESARAALPVLVVNTSPPGATLIVDGVEVGRSPMTLEQLSVGDHLIEAFLEGHEPAFRSVSLPKPGERGFVDLTLSPIQAPGPETPPSNGASQPRPPRSRSQPQAMGKLSLKTTPWTTVFWGTKKLGDTPLFEVPLPAGVHTLKLNNPDTGLESSIEVEVKAGQTTVKKLKL